MDDTKKMLQAIMNHISAVKSELLMKIAELEKRFDGVDSKIDHLDKKIDRVEKNLIDRMDKIGRSLAYLEDDTPTREEHDALVGRVTKLEQKISS